MSASCFRVARSASWPPALDAVIPYVQERKQFGQAIGEFQLVQGKLARPLRHAQCLPRLCLCGSPPPATGARPPRKDSAGCILYAAEKATQAALDADPASRRQWLHQRLPRPAACCATPKLYEIGAGTSEIRRLADRKGDHGGWRVNWHSVC